MIPSPGIPPVAGPIFACAAHIPTLVLQAIAGAFLAMAGGLLARVLLDAASPVEVHDRVDHRRSFVTWLAILLAGPGVWTGLQSLPRIGIAPPDSAWPLLMELSAMAAGGMLMLRAMLRAWVPLTTRYDDGDPFYGSIRGGLNENNAIQIGNRLSGSPSVELAMHKRSRGVGSGMAYATLILAWALLLMFFPECGSG